MTVVKRKKGSDPIKTIIFFKDTVNITKGTVPCKSKLTVSTRTSILEAFKYRVSRQWKNFSRISMTDFKEMINFLHLKQ